MTRFRLDRDGRPMEARRIEGGLRFTWGMQRRWWFRRIPWPVKMMLFFFFPPITSWREIASGDQAAVEFVERLGSTGGGVFSGCFFGLCF